MEFRRVPEEVRAKVRTGIFWAGRYTHVSSTANRDCIGKTGKILSLSMARSEGYYPFSGEYIHRTFLPRMYYVSISRYPNGSEHHWSNYADYANIRWTPEDSESFIQHLEAEKKRIGEILPDMRDIHDPEWRKKIIISIDENIAFEREKQKYYAGLDERQRDAVDNQRPEVYMLGKISSATNKLFHGVGNYRPASHPVVPVQIRLSKSLRAFFTSADLVDSSVDWICSVAGRPIPVASIDALATWDEMIPRLPAYERCHNSRDAFYSRLSDPSFEERVFAEVDIFRF